MQRERAGGERTADTAPFVDTGPSWWQRLLSGNVVAKVGAIILVCGVGFLLKYAYDRGMLPVPLRLAIVAAAGFAMLWGGWKLAARRRLYGLILQGAGLGLLYLDVFFALRVFWLLDPIAGFALLMVLGIATALLAVRQDARVLAVLGLTGAFLAPILAGSREGSHVVLFSYYTLLNASILVISWFKFWRELNLVGFISTFLVGILWGAGNYRPEFFASVEPFVLLFFAMYLLIPILFATRQPPELKGVVDGTLVFGTPIGTAFMQAALVRDLPYGLAWSAGCAAVLYAVLALVVIRRSAMRVLGETYVALAVVLATMTIFFALDAYPTFALWTLEGAAIVWVGLRQRRLLARFFSIALQLAGALLFVLKYAGYPLTNPWFNDFVLGCALIAAAAMITSWLLHRNREVLIEGGEAVAAIVLVWGCAWWFAGGLRALHDALPRDTFHAAALIFAAANFAIVETIGGLLSWSTLRLIARAHLAVLVLGMLTIGSRHPLAGLASVAWPLNFIVFFWCLHWQQRDGIATLHCVRYRLGWLVMALLATWEAVWLMDRHEFKWAFLIGALGIAVAWVRYQLRERGQASSRSLSTWALLWGLTFWLLTGWGYVQNHAPLREFPVAAGLVFVAASCVLFEIAGSSLQWNALRRTQLMLLPMMALALLWQIDHNLHPGAERAWIGWAAAICAHYFVLYRQHVDGVGKSEHTQHILAVWAMTVLVAWELAWRFGTVYPGTSWPYAMLGLVPGAVIFGVRRYGRDTRPWRDDFAMLRTVCLGPLALYCIAWSLLSSREPGVAAPLPYLPLLNPIDLTQAMALLALHTWFQAYKTEPAERSRGGMLLLAVLGFVWLNCILLRSVHHWADVPYTARDLFQSIEVQAAFSLLWTATAMTLMYVATRTVRRGLWMVGVALLGVVVAKLFLLDVANSGTIAQIVSFLGAGVLIMLIGYVAPVPPGDKEEQRG